MDQYKAIVERIASGHTVVLVGGLDSGKTTLGRTVAAKALEEGRTVGYLDAELGQKSVGPPGAVTLRLLREAEDLEGERFGSPDAMYFVGATSPQGQLLPLVVGTARMLDRARDEGADLVVVDTNGVVSGVYGQLLNYHKIELLRPDFVVGMQRGGELDPLLGIVQRFFPVEVIVLPVPAEVSPTSVDERARIREAALQRYFTPPLQRWRVKPTVFMPALPALFDQTQLHRILVGLSDGSGDSIGMGYLDYSNQDGILRLISPVKEAPRALKLGSVRVEEGYRIRRVDLRNLFGTD